MFRKLAAPVALAAVTLAALPPPASAQSGGWARLPTCGEMADGMARAPQAFSGRRPCPPRVERAYAPKHAGLAYDVLAAEDEACFVPDIAWQEMDAIVDATIARAGEVTRDEAGLTRLGQAFARVLEERGYRLLIPTVNLGDALLERRLGDEATRTVDCDTGSMMLITIARKLGFRAALVEMVISSGADHNYVRYDLDGGKVFNWDINGVTACATPEGTPPWQGVPMSDENVMGYVVRLRAWNWQRHGRMDLAMADWRRAADLWPGSPTAANEFAWAVAAGDQPGREAYRTDAVALAERAVALRRDANHLDTLACAWAWAGDLGKAAETQRAAIAELSEGSGARAEFEGRLKLFEAGRDCSGLRTDYPTPDFDPTAEVSRGQPVAGGSPKT